MDQAVSRTASSDQTYRVTMLALTVAFMFAIGGLFILHERRVKEQQALYKQYVADNAWRLPTAKAYRSIKPILLELENLDPAKKPDLVKLAADHAALLTYERAFGSIPRVPNMYARAVDNQGNNTFHLYEHYYRRLTAAWTLRSNHFAKLMVRSYVASELVSEWAANETYANQSKIWTSGFRRAKALAATMSDDELQRRMIVLNQRFAGAASLRPEREALEKDLAKPEQIPPGLDLEYARQLK